MANRFPLIVNPATFKIEELSPNDSLDLSANNIIANGNAGTAGQYLKSNGAQVVWDTPGDVYLNLTQTITNKTFQSCNISGSSNTVYDLPNAALQTPYITFNGTQVNLGGTYSFDDENTTYSISVIDGVVPASEQIIRLTGANPSSTDDVTLKAGSNVTLARTGDAITFNSSYVDTITRLQGGTGGSPETGDIIIEASGSSVVSQNGNVINISSSYVDTITRIKGESAGTFLSGDITFLQSGATTITQNADLITISSQDTITRIKGGATGSLVSGDVTIVGTNATNVTQAGNIVTVDSLNTVTTLEGGVNANPVTGAVKILGGTNVTSTQSGNNITLSSIDTITRIRGTAGGAFAAGDFTFVGADDVQVTQAGNTITISSSDQDTITRLAAFGSSLSSGDFTFTATGAASVSQSGNTINIDAVDTDTQYTASTGLTLTSTGSFSGAFSIKNSSSLTNNKVLKWDNTNGQLVNSIITDDGSTVTIGGNLAVSGTTTTVNSTVVAIADSEIDLRSGENILAGDGGVKVIRTTDGTGAVTSYRTLQWFESGGYWRSFDGTSSNRFVTETETQTLTNKTLTSPILTTPSLGIATATTINKVTITQPTSGATLTINEGKSFTVNNSVTLSGTDNSTISFGGGGTVIYSSNKISALAATTSDELRGVISDETGTGKLTFATNPEFLTSVSTTSTSFNVFNVTATTINAFGAATTISIGATTGSTTVRNNLVVNGTVTLADNIADTITVNGTTTFVNEDIVVRDIRLGRGASGIATNTALGKESLRLVVGVGAGSLNTAVGYETLYFNNSGSRNTVTGYKSGYAISSGSDNTSTGSSALFNNTIGVKNVAYGSSALYTNIQGNNNVCIGHYAGYGLTGSGNVLIGPANNENNSDATYQPPSASGNNQLVIGSGGGTWLRGNSSFELVVPNALSSLGDFTTSGTYTKLYSRILDVNAQDVSFTDKTITIGDVATTNFTATVTQGNTSITITSWGDGLIPGMIVVSQTGGVTVPTNTRIVSIDYVNSTAVLSAAPDLGTGSATFQATGPSNTSADGGGLILKAASDKTLTWNNTASAWTANQHFNVDTGFTYKINNVSMLSSTTLGSTVVNSSLTSVGTLSSLAIAASGSTVGLTITNTGTGDCLVVNDESSDTTPFKIDNAGTLYITGNISDFNASTGTTNQVLSRKAGGGIEWKGLNTLADPNTVTNAGTSTDNAIARFDLATGKIIQNSGVTIDDNGVVDIGTAGNLTGNGSPAKLKINSSAQYDGIALGNGASYSTISRGATNPGLVFTANAAPANLGGSETTVFEWHSGSAGGGGPSRLADLSTSQNFRLGNVDSNPNIILHSVNNGTARIKFREGSTLTSGFNEYSVGMDGTNDRISFEIQASGEVAYITSNGIALPSGKGIDFSANANASGMTSELLDDYEEGTFTPVVTTGWTSPTYSDQIGTYTKIGNVVIVNIILIISGGTATGSGPAAIDGLPFTTSGSSASSIVSVQNATSTPSNQFIRGLISGGTTTIELYRQTSSTLIGVSGSDLGSANLIIRVSATYYTAS